MEEFAAGAEEKEMSFAYLTTLDEVLLTTIHYLEEVRRSSTFASQHFHLLMASRAMRCALEMYRDRAEFKEVKQ